MTPGPNAESGLRVGDLERAIRTLLPGLRNANYVERWSPGSPAVQALSILSEYVGEGPVVAGDLVDPDVPSAHECRPAGRPTSPGVRCGRHFARHPDQPHLVAICTLPAGHGGDCDNLLTRPTPPVRSTA